MTSKINSKSHQTTRILQNSSNLNQSSLMRPNNRALSFTNNISHSLPTNRKSHFCRNVQKTMFSFTPQIHELPYSIFPEKWNEIRQSKKQQWQKLTTNNRDRDVKRKQIQAKEEDKQLYMCTFSPMVSRITERKEKSSHQILSAENSVHERLYDQANARATQRVQIQKKRRQVQQKQFQAKTRSYPILNKQKFDLTALYQRLQQVIEDRNQTRKALTELNQQQHTFKPQINANSQQICKNKQNLGTVVDRLVAQFHNKKKKIESLQLKHQKEIDKELTFKPLICSLPATPTPQHLRIKQQYNQPSFKPQLNPISMIITQYRSGQTSQQKLFHLYDQPLIQKAQNLYALTAQVYNDCSFNPEINSLSKMMGRSSPKQHKCKPQPVIQTPLPYPKINAVSRCMTETRRAQSVDASRRKMQLKATQYRKEVEYSELKECSFRPIINKNKQERKVSNCKSVHIVNGVSQYLQNRQKMFQKERIQKQLQDKMFHLQKSYDRRMLEKEKKLKK